MKAYKFKLYENQRRNRHLHNQINIASQIYNHLIALHKRYYRRFGKYPSAYRIKIHITKLKRLPKYAHWKLVGSQAIQDVVERIDKGYQLFFSEHKKGNKKIRPPSFRKRLKYKSFTLKQAGYQFLQKNRVRIGNYHYRYFKSREIEGKIKTLTIKRDNVGDVYIIVTTDAIRSENQVTTGKIAGFDFGLKTFLTASDGTKIESPLFFNQGSKALKGASRNLSSKKRGSNNRRKARLQLARVHRKIARQREDYHWKLASQLTSTYDVLCFETLNLDGMKRLFGRKISDLGFYSFLQKVKYYAKLKGKQVVFIDKWYPSSKTCHTCGTKNERLELKDRVWTCGNCHTTHDRDLNAAINIKTVGASAVGVDNVRPAIAGSC